MATKDSGIQPRAAVTTGVNALEFPQIASLLTEVVAQATGKTPLTPIDTSQFVSVAQTGLQTGYDAVMGAISQVLSRTIFSVRPYYRKFKGLYVDDQRYGNHVRKLSVIDKPVREDDTLSVCSENAKTDMYDGGCPEVLQLNFYGQTRYSKCIKIFRDQLDVAFSGPDEFQRFIAMLLQNVSDYMEQTHEEMARFTISNLMAGVYTIGGGQVVHLLTEYNAYAGTSLTAQTVKQPENFPGFIRWFYSRVQTISDRLTARSYLYHQNITGKEIARHTPKEFQRVYILDEFINQANTLVLSQAYHDNFLLLPEFEKVQFWQSIESPSSINITPVYLDTTGNLVSPAAPVNLNNVVGVLFDGEAAGYTMVNTWSAPTPFNPRGGFTVNWWHWADRYWNDFTENAVVLVLD